MDIRYTTIITILPFYHFTTLPFYVSPFQTAIHLAAIFLPLSTTANLAEHEHANRNEELMNRAVQENRYDKKRIKKKRISLVFGRLYTRDFPCQNAVAMPISLRNIHPRFFPVLVRPLRVSLSSPCALLVTHRHRALPHRWAPWDPGTRGTGCSRQCS